MMMRFFLPFVLLLSACTPVQNPPQDVGKKHRPVLTLVRSDFNALPGWNNDNMHGAFIAFQKSCARIAKKDPAQKLGALEQAGTYGQWQAICAKFVEQDVASAPKLFETYFTPYQVRADNEAQGLFTGYYEASLRGSRTKSGPYQVPLYARAEDLVMVNLGEFRDSLKGQRIAGRVVDGRLKPYEDRKQITDGQWPHNDKALVWVDNAVDAFFVQIQGSGIVQFEDGTSMRIGYAGQNGHPYYAIGRELIKRGALTKDNVSMQSIRTWLEQNPQQATEIMNTNPSYVFFQELEGEGPLGGEGVALTPARSLAIDRSYLPYGVPLWTDIDAPIAGKTKRLQRLMIAQDTGGAIRGPVRGDVFWGHGQRAEALAGPMKSQGRYWVFLPKTND